MPHPPDNGLPMQSFQSGRQVHRYTWGLKLWLGEDVVDNGQRDDLFARVPRPAAVRVPTARSARIADWHEDRVPAFLVVPPTLGFQDKGAFGAIRHQKAVDDVMDLKIEMIMIG